MNLKASKEQYDIARHAALELDKATTRSWKIITVNNHTFVMEVKYKHTPQGLKLFWKIKNAENCSRIGLSEMFEEFNADDIAYISKCVGLVEAYNRNELDVLPEIVQR